MRIVVRFGKFIPMLVLGLVLSVSGLAGADDERTGEPYTSEPYAFGAGGLTDIAMDGGVLGSASFDDVPAGHWADEEIGWAVANGLMGGVADRRFGVAGVVPRWEIVTFLFRLADLTDIPMDSGTSGLGSASFVDVPAGHRADREIGWAVANGITKGRGGGLFDPGGSVTRAQIVTFLFRLAGLTDIAMDGDVLGSASFDDVPAGHWADEEIGWAVANRITQGVGDGLFDMGRVVTRAQIATFMFRVARVVKPADTPVVGVSSSLERCASAGQPGSGVLAVLAGTSAEGFYQPIVGPGSPGSCERIMEWWEQARRAEAERINRGEYPCRYLSPPEGYDFGDAGRTHGPPYLVGCWPTIIAHDAKGFYVYPPNSPPFVEAVWNCYKTALEGSPPGWDGYWWPTIVDCHSSLLVYGHPMYGMGIDPACAAESYTRRVAESLIGERPIDDGYYSGPNSWTNCSTRAERMVPDTGQTFQQRCLAVIAAAAKDPHAAENIEQQAAVHGVEPADYLTEWGNIVCGDWSFETIKNAEINGIPLERRVHIAYWTPRPEAQCHQQVILNLAESYLRGVPVPTIQFC